MLCECNGLIYELVCMLQTQLQGMYVKIQHERTDYEHCICLKAKRLFCAILMFCFSLELVCFSFKFAVITFFYHLFVSEMSTVEQLDEGDDSKGGWRERVFVCW